MGGKNLHFFFKKFMFLGFLDFSGFLGFLGFIIKPRKVVKTCVFRPNNKYLSYLQRIDRMNRLKERELVTYWLFIFDFIFMNGY